SSSNGAGSRFFSHDELKATASDPDEVPVPVNHLEDITLKAIKTYGYSDDEAQIMCDVMMYAQLRGNNQGIIKVATGGIARTEGCGRLEVEHETELSALINGNKDAGMLALYQALELGVMKASKHGFGIVGTHNTPTSTGALGFYAEKVAQQGYIAVVLAQSPEFVAPHGAKQPIFGTNPIGVGIPTNGRPVVLDMATSAYSYFGLLEAKTAGQPIPDNVALDGDGKPTTDPNEALKGAIQVFDRSYKGSNLALIVELLAGSLVGAAIEDKLASKSWGNLIAVIDPALLGSPEEFRSRVEVVLDRVKTAERQPGVDSINLPGERGNRLAQQRLDANQLPVESNLLRGLEELAAKYQPAASAPGAYKIATQLVHPEKVINDPYMASNTPIYQTATFGQPTATTFGEYDYSRSGNPTRTVLEEQMAALEGAHRAFAFASGMSALAVVCRLVAQGEKIVAGDDIYGGTSRLLMSVLPKHGVEVVNVDTTDLAAMEQAITADTKLVMLESPTNPRMQVIDIAAISKLAHAKGALVVVDNSIMAPTFQRPLDLGADISMTSATKFICGHSDVMGGILAAKDPAICDDIYFHQNAEGTCLGPFDCWLCLRGIKTMSLRMEKQAESALKMARWLEAHPLVKRVNFPGLPSNVGYELHRTQASGTGSILSFATGDVNISKIVVEEAKLFKITVSFGNVTSLISLPCFMSHASIPAEVRAARGLPDDLVRISVGIEDVDDLIADLDAALQKAAAATQGPRDLTEEKEQSLLARIKTLEAQLNGK
ncbi:hypothetical protein CYMTET_50124, partial [Cymbomonas tetramitiformis]